MAGLGGEVAGEDECHLTARPQLDIGHVLIESVDWLW